MPERRESLTLPHNPHLLFGSKALSMAPMNAIRLLVLFCAIALAGAQPARADLNYAVVISKANHDDPAWKAVGDALLAKHPGKLFVYTNQVWESLPELRQWHPRHTCFVASSDLVTREFTAAVHRLTRQYDDDPYVDTIWGILTGFDAANALAIAQNGQPLTIHRIASHTDLAYDMVDSAVAFDELSKNKLVRKEPGKEPVVLHGPDDTAKAMVDVLNDEKPDLILASGHASEKDWMLGYTYRNGTFQSHAGKMFGHDTKGASFPVHSPNPKVYLPVGNCLMGHIDSTNAMALAWMNSVGVQQMIGYTFPTWYGYSGWGCLDYFVEQPGRYTFAEAFQANQCALIQRLLTYAPEAATQEAALNGNPEFKGELTPAAAQDGVTQQDINGLFFDRDVVVFYGDPAWEARMANHPKAWDQTLVETNGIYTFTIHPNRGTNTFKPINANGSQRGGRPIIQFFPHRLREITVLEGADLHPVLTDDFLLIPNPKSCDPARPYVVRFKAGRIDKAD